MTGEGTVPSREVVMSTVSGQEFRPFDPRPEDVELGDVAHALSNICRCSGQTRWFYSVGLHSLYVSRNLRERDANPRVKLYGLLHDAPEAYVSDVVAPVKRHLDRYRDLERDIMTAVWGAFDLPEPTEAEWAAVEDADRRVRRYELATLLPDVVEGDPPALSYDLRGDESRDVAAAFDARARTLVAETDAALP